jgi:pimeloyl-ACP methyl ester carboxylesterase
MEEQPLLFGGQRHLMGMMTLPGADVNRQPLGVMLLNAGVIHRVGPHRLNVKLARHLAGLGYPCIRIDLSGLGDSRAGTASVSFREQSVLDIQAALGQAQHHLGTDRFVVVGICSGAHNGLAAALADSRIAGLLMLDGYAYPTRKTRWVRLAQRYHALSWQELAAWPVRRALKAVSRAHRSVVAKAAPAAPQSAPSQPGRDEYAAMVGALVDRGAKVYAVFSGSMLETYNYAQQFHDAFAGHAFVGRMKCEFLPEIDHTLTPVASQRLLMSKVASWLSEISAGSVSTIDRNASTLAPTA